jgi:AhpC/TSA family
MRHVENSAETRDCFLRAKRPDRRQYSWRLGEEIRCNHFGGPELSGIQQASVDRTDCRRPHCLSRGHLATMVNRIRSSKSMKGCFVQLTLVALLILSGCYSGSRPKGIGRAAPNFVVQDSERKIFLSQFRGQIVVLNFWASWCPPCIENPSLVDMQRRLQPKGVAVGISADEDETVSRTRFLSPSRQAR